MLDYIIDFFKEVFVPVFAALVVVVALAIGLVAGINFIHCTGFESGTGIKTKWRFGCYAFHDGKWMPSDHVFGNANELRIKNKGNEAQRPN